MPLTMLNPGEEGIIAECRAKESIKRFLEGLGIVPGVEVSIINEMGGSLILSVRGSRIALNKGLAQQLTIEHRG